VQQPADRPHTQPPGPSAPPALVGSSSRAVAAGDGQGGLAGVGSPGASSGRAAGPQPGQRPGRRVDSGGPARRPRDRRRGSQAQDSARPAGGRASITASDPSGCGDQVAGREENAAMARAADAAVDRPGACLRALWPAAGRADPARCSPARRGPPGRARSRARLRRAAWPVAHGRCEGVVMGGWSACRRSCPLTYRNRVCRAFFHGRPRNRRPGKSRGHRAHIFSRGRRGGPGALSHGMDLACTCDRPAMYLACGRRSSGR